MCPHVLLHLFHAAQLGIDLRGRHRSVTQKLTHISNPGTVSQQVGGKGVAELVRGGLEAVGSEEFGQAVAQLGSRQRLALFFKQVDSGSLRLPVMYNLFTQIRKKRELAHFVSLTKNTNPLCVDLLKFQRRELTDPQPQPIQHRDQKLILRCGRLHHFTNRMLIDGFWEGLWRFDCLISECLNGQGCMIVEVAGKRTDRGDFGMNAAL